MSSEVVMPPRKQDYPAASVRITRPDGQQVVYAPHDLFYAMALFQATEFWDADTKTWKAVDHE